MSESDSSLLQLYNLEGEFDEIIRQYNKEYANCVGLFKNVTPTNYLASSQEVQASINNLDSLNEKLLNLNQQITLKLKSIQIASIDEENKNRLDSLLSTYGILLKEQSKIKQMQKEYETIYAEDNAQYRNVNHQHAQYIFWVIVSCIVVFLLSRLLFFPSLQLDAFKFFFWVILLSFLAIALLYSYISTGFLIVSLLLAYIILGFMKILPMP